MRSPEDFPADIRAAAIDVMERILAMSLAGDMEDAIARALMERDRAATEITEDDIWLLASAAENLRGGSQNEERRVDAAFRIAFKLDELRKRMSQP